MESGLKDLRVIVTGGTRRIGKTIVEQFASEGARVTKLPMSQRFITR